MKAGHVSTSIAAHQGHSSAGATLGSNQAWAGWWNGGTRFYAWHLTFDASPVVELAAAYQQALTGTAGLELVPPRWLHLTVHGVGLLEEISIRQVRSIADAVARELSLVGAQPATFDRWSVNHGVICLMPASTAVFNDVRGAVRAGMAEVLGATGLAEPVDGFEPHVSIAFVTADQPAAPVVERLSAVTASPATHVVRSADLLEMYRGADAYQWRRIATAELGFPALGEQ